MDKSETVFVAVSIAAIVIYFLFTGEVIL